MRHVGGAFAAIEKRDFTENIARAQHVEHGVFSLRGERDDLDLTFQDHEQAAAGIALREDRRSMRKKIYARRIRANALQQIGVENTEDRMILRKASLSPPERDRETSFRFVTIWNGNDHRLRVSWPSKRIVEGRRIGAKRQQRPVERRLRKLQSGYNLDCQK